MMNVSHVRIFVFRILTSQTRKEASWLEGRMTMDGHRVVILSGDLDVSRREQVIGEFRNAECRVLITTNVCSRGKWN